MLVPLTTLLVAPATVNAAQMQLGDVSITIDTTVSASASMRVSKQGCEFISVYNGGCLGSGGTDYDVNSDDGNVNVERGDFISAPVKIISEADVKWENLGFFVRAKAFYDYVGDKVLGTGSGKYGPILAGGSQRRQLEDAFRGDGAHNLQARSLDLLDAFAYGNFVVADTPITMRLGRQAVNWGESLFIPGGVSAYLPLDVSALVRPGVELKEIFLPQNSVFASVSLPANFSFEAQYVFQWERSVLPACGSFFSPSDAASDGCRYALSGGEVFNLPGGGSYAPTTFIPRGRDQEGRDGGEYGFALRYYAEWLNKGTELSTYFVNFHAKLPFGTTTASMPTATTPVLQAVCNPAVPGSLSGPGCTSAVPGLTDDAGRPVSFGQAVFADAAGDNKSLIVQFPEDIEMFGASFNTTVPIIGDATALSGELAYFPDMPFQLATNEIQGADIQNFGYTPGPGEPSYYNGTPVAPGSVIPGYRYTEALHGQIYTLSTLTPSDPIVGKLGGDLLILVGNVGFQYLPDAEGNRYAIPRADETHANPGTAATLGDNCVRLGTCALDPLYASSFSWGYRLLAQMDYHSAFGSPFTLSPQIVWSHDVSGFSAGPIGPGFVEGKKAVTLGLGARYLESYNVSLNYTNNFGARYRNASHDKDFVSLTASYSF
ncbi:MAG: DUF1302 domain-containing protein [Parvibaculum sp.]|nr:DUF1302 domain-containing protein [Parvibaculum sp.]